MAEDIKELKPKTNFKPQGKSGTLVTGYEVQEDYLSSLNGPRAQDLFHKMLLSDSTIRKVVHAVSNPIKSAKWDIEPASDSPEDLEVAALIKHIIFHDIHGGFQDKLDEILVFPWRGHAIFEVVHKNRFHETFGAYTGLQNLAYRESRTIDEWYYSDAGVLEKIHQIQEGDIQVNSDIMAENLLIFFNEKKGDDTGYPFCRMLYGNYKRKLLYKELQAIGIERAALPVPHLEVPETVQYDSEEYQDACDQLAAFTQAEQAYFVTPAGYKLNYNQTGTYDPQKVQAAIKAENEEIAGSVVAMWLEMGLGGNAAVGSSTGESLKFFVSGIEYIANKISNLINRELIPNLIALNFGKQMEVMPKLVHNGISDEAGKELMEIVTGYTEKGIITPDEALEDHIRKVHNLPKKIEGEMLENGETQEDSIDTIDDNEPSGDIQEEQTEEVELSSKSAKSPKALINSQREMVYEDLKSAITFSAEKFIVDTMNRYKQLPDNKKQNATSTVKVGGANKLKKDLKRNLTATVNKSIDMARKDIPGGNKIELNSKDEEVLRISEKYGDITDIKLNENSKLPAHIQLLISKQADLISEDTLQELKSRLSFSYSSAQLRTKDENVLTQMMQDDAEEFINAPKVKTKATNVTSLMVNEGRNSFFFSDEVAKQVESYTFTNFSPKSDICKELAGKTFKSNDAQSFRYHPPLHHNCKSYLVANLKGSNRAKSLEAEQLAPTAKAIKSITL